MYPNLKTNSQCWPLTIKRSDGEEELPQSACTYLTAYHYTDFKYKRPALLITVKRDMQPYKLETAFLQNGNGSIVFKNNSFEMKPCYLSPSLNTG